MQVRDLMTDSAIALTPRESLAAAWDTMNTHSIRHIPVVDEEGLIVGVLSHRDIVGAAVPEEAELPLANRVQSLASMAVGEVMSRDVETADPADDIISAAQSMLDNKLGCLPVAEGRRLVGILTESDFVRYVLDARA